MEDDKQNETNECSISKRPSLVRFLRESPLVGLDLNLDRETDQGRDVDLSDCLSDS